MALKERTADVVQDVMSKAAADQQATAARLSKEHQAAMQRYGSLPLALDILKGVGMEVRIDAVINVPCVDFESCLQYGFPCPCDGCGCGCGVGCCDCLSE